MGFISVGLAAAIQILLSGCGASSTDSGSLTAEHQSLKTEHESLKTDSQGLKDKYESLMTEHQSLKTERESLKTANQSLTKQVNDLKFGADRIIASVQLDYSKKRYTDAKVSIKLLEEKHPESIKNAEFRELLKTIEQEELAAEQKRLAEEKEKHRLANLQNTGMWVMREYVDMFKEKTGEKFLINEKWIKGIFNNSATENSKLTVQLFSDSNGVYVQLYEYEKSIRKNPFRDDFLYRITIQDGDGARHAFSGTMLSGHDRIVLSNRQTDAFHSIMKKGGQIKFSIEGVSPIVKNESYFFIIPNPDFYENALRLMTEKK